MTDMLAVPTSEVCHPIAMFILMKPGNSLFHIFSLRFSALGAAEPPYRIDALGEDCLSEARFATM